VVLRGLMNSIAWHAASSSIASTAPATEQQPLNSIIIIIIIIIKSISKAPIEQISHKAPKSNSA